jgi:hypothetical protein
MKISTFSTSFVFYGECFTNGITTLWSMLITCTTICCMFQGPKLYKRLHSGSWRENKEHCISYCTSETFLIECTIPVLLHVFRFLLIVEQDIVFIQDAVFFFFFARVCVLPQYWSLSCVTWRIFYCGAFPHIIRCPFPSLPPPPHTLAITFRHLSSRATPCTPANWNILTRKSVYLVGHSHL